MSTPYHELEDKHRDQTLKRVLICLVVLCTILLVTALVIVGVMHHRIVELSSSDTPIEYCITEDCLKLASEISSSINESVDPCDDFYHYACDGWADEYSWTEINVQSYGQFSNVFEGEKRAFLDAMFYKTKSSLVDHSSVEKAQTYFLTCQESIIDMDELEESEFFAIIQNHTSFATSDTWDSTQQQAFHDSLVYLTQINYNTLFQLRPAATKTPAFLQYVGYWQLYAAYSWGNDTFISRVMVPLYEEHFGMSSDEAKSMAQKVASFADDVSDISTVTEDEYYDRSAYINMMKYGNFSEYASMDTAYLNYTRLVLDVYGVDSKDEAPSKRLYLSGGVSFFEGLSAVISSHSPQTVQLFMLSSILYYWVNFKDTYSQSNYEDRTDFCFDRTIEAFPFVYGYIIYNTVYDDEKHHIVSSMTQHIKDKGVKAMIEDSSWLDDVSKEAALKKIEAMALYIGFPTMIGDGDNIDRYYRDAQQDDSVSWMANLESMTKWDYITQNATFWGNAYNLTADWPGIFADESTFPYWLTGINAFYLPSENFFTIPATISQPPFLDGDSEYPSAVAYGGLGVVCGHEMSHGFDPNGASYNWNGTYVGSIFSNQSRAEYEDKMECLVDQYDNIVVETLPTGRKVYGKGNVTITENVADNAGVWAAWVAWKDHVAESGNDKRLYGVDLTQEQLFFLGYARLWCDTSRPGYYANWTDVHSPHYARVVAPLQNNPHFATAFGCESGSFMNPEKKCSVW